MSSHSQPETHPVLLGIAGAAFVVLMLLGIGLSGSTKGHTANGHAAQEVHESGH